ncbi:hypothetical protein [Microscilla marina]|uniref:Uncharacterized protein n=1 Tax=Microscilla marina ATCC 23134 TaxID=313606 RepID=A1ZG33_MICM2|nr:hypothetical protein [Microscilla marina]EAY30450.1 hypothetical protein M23134_03086 [Microscilla marina ATCC 23134]
MNFKTITNQMNFWGVMTLVCLFLAKPQQSKAQGDLMAMADSANVFAIPFGYTQIGETGYVGFRLQPELAFGKIGVGLDIPIMFSTKDGSFRAEEFQDGLGGVLRMIQYFRYGRKRRDPFYIKVGVLRRSYLGFGGLLNNYTNSPSFERRKVGFEFDISPGNRFFGVEGLYSDINGLNLLAVRPYVRPFVNSLAPIINTFEIGVGVVHDRSQQALPVASTTTPLPITIPTTSADSTTDLRDTRYVNNGMTGLNVDAGITLLNIPFIKVDAYTQYAFLLKNNSDSLKKDLDAIASVAGNEAVKEYGTGSGFSAGVRARLNFIANIFAMEARLEYQNYSKFFRPQFFDAAYEINKDAGILALATDTTATNGIYGTLSGHLLNKIKITGGLQLPFEISKTNPALLFIQGDATGLIPKVVLSGTYVKGNLFTLQDALVLDDRSLANVRAAYQLYSWLTLGVDFRWTFAKVTNDTFDPPIERVEATRYVMPYVGINIPLFSNKSAN